MKRDAKTGIQYEVLKDCSLLQACEWIAFGWEPMKPVYEKAIGRYRENYYDFKFLSQTEYIDRDEIREAQNILKCLLYSNKINATGILFKSVDFDLEVKPTSLKRQNLTEIKEYIDDFQIIFYKSALACYNTIDKDWTIAKYVEINFEELKKVYPRKKIVSTTIDKDKKDKTEYKSFYLQLMLEVIKEEKITKNNQSKQEVLKDIFVNKLKKLGYASNKHCRCNGYSYKGT